MMSWKVILENGTHVFLRTDMTSQELAAELQAQPAGGYVCDDDVIIPVRRVMCCVRAAEL